MGGGGCGSFETPALHICRVWSAQVCSTRRDVSLQLPGSQLRALPHTFVHPPFRGSCSCRKSRVRLVERHTGGRIEYLQGSFPAVESLEILTLAKGSAVPEVIISYQANKPTPKQGLK